MSQAQLCVAIGFRYGDRGQVSILQQADGWHVVVAHPTGDIDVDEAAHPPGWAQTLCRARAALWGYRPMVGLVSAYGKVA